MPVLSDSSSVSIVIPVYNGGESFVRCVKSLQQWSAFSEVIVVADGDSDGSWKIAKRAGFRVIRLPESVGPAKARNIGAIAASMPILLFVDADVEINSTTVSRVVAAFEDYPNIAALIGSYDDSPGASNFLSQYKNLFHHYTHQDGKVEASTFWGACGAIRREVFLKMGGFDETYRQPCIEDIELGYRLRQAGYCIRLCKEIQVKHLKQWKPISLLRAEIFYRALPWMALLLSIQRRDPQQYRVFSSDLNLKWSSRASVVLVYSFCLSVLVALWWPFALMATVLLSAILLLINWPVYRFFYCKRGGLFTLQVLPWHWLYFFYSGLAFVVGTIRHHIQSFYLFRY